jgi:hypothetical protein
MAKGKGVSGFLASLPGIKGYKEKEQRREADKKLRVSLANALGIEQRRLVETQQQLVLNKDYNGATEVDRVQAKLQLFIDRVKTASYGYAGLFDAVQVKEEQLDALAAFDQQLAAQLGRVTAAVKLLIGVVRKKEDITDAISGLNELFDELNDTFSQRSEAITGA